MSDVFEHESYKHTLGGLYIEVKEDQGYDLAFSTFSSLEQDERDWQGSVFLVFSKA